LFLSFFLSCSGCCTWSCSGCYTVVEPTGGGLRMLYVVFSETATEPSPVGPSRQVTVFNDPALPTSDQADVDFHVGQVTGKHRNRVAGRSSSLTSLGWRVNCHTSPVGHGRRVTRFNDPSASHVGLGRRGREAPKSSCWTHQP
jgi:hypothetical protein